MSSLILVSLPIGNSQDITIRALEALKSGKNFYAEDTRVFKKLLETLGIGYQDKFIDSFHDHTEGKVDTIIEKIKSGAEIFLVSDAGSPVISDPAYPLLKRVKEENLTIKTLPGVTSVVTALELSGLPPHPFHFWGFIARSAGEKKNFFKEAAAIAGTHIFFESPHRIYETVQDFFKTLPDGELVVTRELTKTFESVARLKRENLSELSELVVSKGEFVVLFHCTGEAESSNVGELKELALDYLEGKSTPKKLAKLLSKILGVETKSIYDRLSHSDE